MDETRNVIYYFSSNNIINYIEDKDDTNTLKFLCPKELNKPEHKFSYFRPFENYFKTHEDLIRFKKDFSKDCNEIKSVNISTQYRKRDPIIYKNYYSHNDAVYHMLKCKNKKEQLNVFEKVSKDEFLISERCLNSGLMCINLNYKFDPKSDIPLPPTQSYGYDFSRFYANILPIISIPTKQGIVSILTSVIFGKLKFGIYRVKLTYDNVLSNIFNPSKLDHYTSGTLNDLYKIKDNYHITFTLLEPTEEFNYNALVYEYEDLIEGKTLFRNWLTEMEQLREKLPKNRLVKHLMTTLAGSLMSFNKIYVDDISNYDAQNKHNHTDSEYKILDVVDGKYILAKCDDAFKHGLARLKPYLMAYARTYMMKFLIKNKLSNDVIRIHTDCMIMPYPVDFTKMNLEYYPKPESKTTGLLSFHNVNSIYHVCVKCNKEFRFKEFEVHLCEL